LGELDLDSDWDAYIQELNNRGLEKYMEIANAAYGRMK